ncbi:hypothetical protein GQ602_003281 [Ophiocordyceps camponoti-floridani]|uniref:Nascent polypeptide-associated complex subunit alpha-like UBA domain-containing protein n=1 Tax=Ophiocordyceps camponoti-floridani TaxID=2030778 RepID=A0A8H4Q7X0_9HYPO|nr:hypothetical protein GQ602_003281 [Ophiocordyceps camponoti-floridani]
MPDERPPTSSRGDCSPGAGPDADEEAPAAAAKSAEDRKAASALASLDANHDDDAANASAKNLDRDAVDKAIKRLGGAAAAAPGAKTTTAAPSTKNVKVDAADVALLVEELELPRQKATELLKAHDGDVVAAIRAFVQPCWLQG